MKTMKTGLVLVAAAAAAIFLSGCLGEFAANQARRQAARTADHYVREYVEPELDPEGTGEFRSARDDIADTIVRTGNEERQPGRVGVNERGYIINR